MLLVDEDGTPVADSSAPPSGVLLDDDGNPVAPTSAAKVGRGVLVDDSGMPLTHADVHHAFVARYPGDPISKIQERKAHPPPNARASATPAPSLTFGGAIRAGLKGIGADPEAMIRGVKELFAGESDTDKEELGLGDTQAPSGSPSDLTLTENGRTKESTSFAGVARRTAQAPTVTGKVAAASGYVPLAGDIAGGILQPAVAASENRPVTPEENEAAIGSAAMAGTMLLPAAYSAAKARVANVLRARGAVIPETGPVEAPIAPETSVASGPAEAAAPETSPPAAEPSIEGIAPTITAETGSVATTADAAAATEDAAAETESANGEPSPFRKKIVGDFVDEMRRRLMGEDRIPFTPEMSAVAKRLRFHLRADDYLGFDSPRDAIDAILQHPDFAERWDVSDPVRLEGERLQALHRQLVEGGSADVVRMPFGARAAESVPEMPEEGAATGPSSDAELINPPKPPDDEGGGTPPSQPPPVAPDSGGAPPPPPPPPPGIARAVAKPTPEPPPLPSVDDPAYVPALRTRYTGSVDVRALEGNQITEWMKKTLTPAEQDALSLMRDEKGQPGSTQSLIDGTHPVYQEPNTSHAHVEAMSDVAQLALNPTPDMLMVDGVLDSYFAKTLKEAKEKGVVDSSIEPGDYIPHLLQPAEGIEPGRTGSPGGISETTPFALKRKNPTILEAMARGLDPRTINAADAVSIYAKRHGLAMAAQILEDTLKESGIGKSITAGNAPEGWGEVGEGTRAFKRQVPYHDESGKLPDGSNHIAVANQALYAPQKIVDALKPITEPNYMLKVPGWEKTQRFQDYIKSANVALAFFHLKAITITAFNSMRLGPVDMMKAYMIGVDDPFFMESERNLVVAGGKTSAVARTAESYRALEPTALPSRVDAIRNLPVMRQLDAAAQATSKLTFDLALRKTKVMDFASKDAAWIAEHPNATDLELAEARRSTARTLNANYGGLNWEALGYTRTVHAILRATMFAPDWTISNLESVTQAARGGPGGAQARWYMARSIVGGIGATAAMTYFLTGKTPDQVPGSMKDKLFNVYLGDDEKGNHKFMNLFFAGAPNDVVNLAANVVDYGAGKGLGMSIATKTNVLPRLGMHVPTNKDFMGRDIVPDGAGPVLGTAISVRNASGELAPVPFSVKNAAQMATDARREYSPAEYAAAMIAGVRPRHVADRGGKVPITETKWVDEPPKNSAWDILVGGKPVYKHGK